MSLREIFLKLSSLRANRKNSDLKDKKQPEYTEFFNLIYTADPDYSKDPIEILNFFGFIEGWDDYPVFMNTTTNNFVNCYACDMLFDCINRLSDSYLINEDSGNFADKCEKLAIHFEYENILDVVLECVSVFEERKSLALLKKETSESELSESEIQ